MDYSSSVAMLLEGFSSYEDAHSRFHWSIPEWFNIAEEVCGRHARAGGSRLALIALDAAGEENRFTFAQLDDLAARFAAVLAECGIERGDRVATILPQSAAPLVAHIGALKLGAVVLPLTTLFGPDALEYRLRDSGSRAVVVDAASRSKLDSFLSRLPALRQVFVVDGSGGAGFWAAVRGQARKVEPVRTRADDPAFLLYTSGSTGDPKGALHAHRFLLGHLTSFEMYNNLELGSDAVFWSPADWAWIGALFDLVYPALYYGLPVVGHRPLKFSGEEAFRLMERYRLTHLFVPPTALRVMKKEMEKPRQHFRLALRVISSGGEAVTPEIFDWVDRELCPLNEIYGQTEANLLVGNCRRWFSPLSGSMGKAVPGHQVEVLNEDGAIALPGETGQIAVRRPDPVLFLEYLNKPDKTAAAFRGEWLVTGDSAYKDEQGYFWFRGRTDDLINAAGYRIGPTEVERAIMQHPAVAECAVVGIPDALRGAIVKAFIRLNAEGQDLVSRERLAEELQSLVRERMGGFAYPREVEFVEQLPMTTTGKIRRSELREREMARRQKE